MIALNKLKLHNWYRKRLEQILFTADQPLPVDNCSRCGQLSEVINKLCWECNERGNHGTNTFNIRSTHRERYQTLKWVDGKSNSQLPQM